MCNQLNKEYYNITRECVEVYLSLCTVCNDPQKKRQKKFEDPQVYPKPTPKLNVNALNGKGWVAFLDYEEANGKQNILIYREQSTKFCHLRAISDLKPITVSLTLMEVMTGFGVPYILYVDGSQQFQEDIMAELAKALPRKIVLGKDEVFQDDMNAVKLTVLEKLHAIEDLSWPISLKIVQQQMNTTEISGNITPYELMFGSKMNTNNVDAGLAALPAELVADIFSEGDSDDFH